MIIRLISICMTALVIACGGGGAPTPVSGGPPPSGIGPAGGTVSLPGGPAVIVPEDALAAFTPISISTTSSAAPAWALSDRFLFGPDGTEFATSVTVAFPIAEGVTAAAVYWTKPGSTTEYDVFPATVLGTVARAEVSHFSSGFVGPASADPCEAGGTWKVTCTPPGGACGAAPLTLEIPAGSTRTGGPFDATALGTTAAGTFDVLACAAATSFADACGPGADATLTLGGHTLVGTARMACPDACGGGLVEWQCAGQRPGWYDVYGTYCGDVLRPRCNHYDDGTKIIDNEDPYFQASYQLEYAYWEYVDDYGYTQYYLGWAWLSPDSILYDDYGRALN